MSNRKPLIDADMLRYECGFGVEFNEDGGKFIHNFEPALDLLEHKIRVILEETEATEPPTLYLTQDKAMAARHKEEYVPNFREAIAVSAVYKGTRASGKPFHYDNLTEYMLSKYDCIVAKGYEADDLLSIHQGESNKDYETIICSRDKDLRITPGWHYTWECGKARAYGPHYVEPLGHLDAPVKNKMFGTGLKFFYSQMITGDTVDNIKGMPGRGPAYAYKILNECENEEELFNAVRDVYVEYFNGQSQIGEWREYFKEQAALLWMIQEFDEHGNLVHYIPFDER